MNNDDLPLGNMRGAFFRYGSVRGCRGRDQYDISSGESFAHIQGGKFQLAESLDYTADLDSALLIYAVDCVWENIVKPNRISHEGQVASYRLASVASADNRPSGLLAHSGSFTALFVVFSVFTLGAIWGPCSVRPQ
jgi:hypothetical protein